MEGFWISVLEKGGAGSLLDNFVYIYDPSRNIFDMLPEEAETKSIMPVSIVR